MISIRLSKKVLELNIVIEELQKELQRRYDIGLDNVEAKYNTRDLRKSGISLKEYEECFKLHESSNDIQDELSNIVQEKHSIKQDKRYNFTSIRRIGRKHNRRKRA